MSECPEYYRALTFEIPTKALATSNSKGVGKNGHIFDKHKGKAAYVATVRMFAKTAVIKHNWHIAHGPLWVSFEFVFVRPRSHYGTGRNALQLKLTAPEWPTGKRNDRTNCLKSTEDALTGIIWYDDSQIVDGPVTKRYGPQEVIRVTVRELDDIPGVATK